MTFLGAKDWAPLKAMNGPITCPKGSKDFSNGVSNGIKGCSNRGGLNAWGDGLHTTREQVREAARNDAAHNEADSLAMLISPSK